MYELNGREQRISLKGNQYMYELHETTIKPLLYVESGVMLLVM